MKEKIMEVIKEELVESINSEPSTASRKLANCPVMEVDAESIELDLTLQTRVEMDQATVAEYADLMSSGHVFPPVIVFKENGKHFLVDGFHRLQAHLQIGGKKVLAKILEGTRQDAILCGIFANAQHGLSRSNADKKKAVELILAVPEWNEWAYTYVAKICGVSDSFVRKVKMATSNGSKVAEVKKFEKNGKIVTMNTASISKSRSTVKMANTLSLEDAVSNLEIAVRELLDNIEHFRAEPGHEEILLATKEVVKDICTYRRLVIKGSEEIDQAV